MAAPLSYREIIRSALDERLRKNHRYSLRSFAKALDVSPALLSGVLSGKKRVTSKLSPHFVKKLGLGAVEGKVFSLLVLKDECRDPQELARVQQQLETILQNRSHLLDFESFSAVSDWVHFAILEMVRLKDFSPDFGWMARRLAVPPLRVRLAVERLLERDLLRRDPSGGLTVIHHSVEATADSKSQRDPNILESYFLPLSERSMAALATTPRGECCYTMWLIGVDQTKIAEFRNRILAVQDELFAEFVDNHGPYDRIYTFSIQLMPLTSAAR